jgi:hypothetical protein
LKITPLISSALLFISGLLWLGNPLLAEDNAAALKTKVVEAFMSARMLENNVAARNLMTANLEDAYLHNKKLSVRVRSGRIAAFDFDPASIETPNNKEFRITVRSVWADLNEQVYEMETERLKFISLNNEWLADSIDFLKKIPIPGPPPLQMEDVKRFKMAATTAKKFSKAIVNQDGGQIMELTSQKFHNQFISVQALLVPLLNSPDLYCSAYDWRDYKLITPRQIEFKVGFYMARKGGSGFTEVEAIILTEEGASGYTVSSFAVTPAKPAGTGN